VNQIFPYANIVTGILILIVGFIFHWIGQFISVVNWKFAIKIGLQESKMPKEYRVYEHAIAVADAFIGWIYGFAAIGLILNTTWAYKLSWIPGVVLIYHSISYWFWTNNRNRDGNKLESNTMRISWFMANLITGILAIFVAWNAS
jgi:hypothetical protein